MPSVQSVRGGGQLTPHALFAHAAVPTLHGAPASTTKLGIPESGLLLSPAWSAPASAVAQVVMHVPQWLGSAVRSTQPASVHAVVGGAHVFPARHRRRWSVSKSVAARRCISAVRRPARRRSQSRHRSRRGFPSRTPSAQHTTPTQRRYTTSSKPSRASFAGRRGGHPTMRLHLPPTASKKAKPRSIA